MLTDHLDLNLPNQALSKPKPALQASAFPVYFSLEATLHLILCVPAAFFHCLLANLYPFQYRYVSNLIDMNTCLFHGFDFLRKVRFGCKYLFSYCLDYILYGLEHGLRTTPWFHVSVPQRSCIQGRATWSLQLELCYANTIRCTEVISSPYGLNVQLWEVILESLKSWSKYPDFVPSFSFLKMCVWVCSLMLLCLS